MGKRGVGGAAADRAERRLSTLAALASIESGLTHLGPARMLASIITFHVVNFHFPLAHLVFPPQRTINMVPPPSNAA